MTEYRTSSFCNADSPMCVEVARHPDGVTLRDTAGAEVSYTLDEWRAFLAGVRAGEFNI